MRNAALLAVFVIAASLAGCLSPDQPAALLEEAAGRTPVVWQGRLLPNPGVCVEGASCLAWAPFVDERAVRLGLNGSLREASLILSWDETTPITHELELVVFSGTPAESIWISYAKGPSPLKVTIADVDIVLVDGLRLYVGAPHSAAKAKVSFAWEQPFHLEGTVLVARAP